LFFGYHAVVAPSCHGSLLRVSAAGTYGTGRSAEEML